MRDTFGEVPDVTVRERLGLVSAVLVDGRHDNGAGVDEAPLGLQTKSVTERQSFLMTLGATYHAVPVELADGAFLQVLLGGGNVMALRQVLDDLLAQPAAIEQPCLGVGESPLQVWDDAVVGALPAEVVRILLVYVLVRTAFERVSLSNGDAPRTCSPNECMGGS